MKSVLSCAFLTGEGRGQWRHNLTRRGIALCPCPQSIASAFSQMGTLSLNTSEIRIKVEDKDGRHLLSGSRAVCGRQSWGGEEESLVSDELLWTLWLAGRARKWILLCHLCIQCCAPESQVTGPISMVTRKEMCIKWPLVVPDTGTAQPVIAVFSFLQ